MAGYINVTKENRIYFITLDGPNKGEVFYDDRCGAIHIQPASWNYNLKKIKNTQIYSVKYNNRDKYDKRN